MILVGYALSVVDPIHFTASGAFAEPTVWPEAEPMEVAKDLGKADVTFPPQVRLQDFFPPKFDYSQGPC